MKDETRQLIEHHKKTDNSKFGQIPKTRKLVARRLWDFGTKNFRDWLLRN